MLPFHLPGRQQRGETLFVSFSRPSLARRGRSILARVFIFAMLGAFVLAACSPAPAPTALPVLPTSLPETEVPSPSPAPSPAPSPTPVQVSSPAVEAGGTVLAAYVQDGNVLLWEQATGQSKTLYSGGDAIAVTLSPDGQVLAFLVRSVVQKSEFDWYEGSALWAMDINGDNPRELVPFEELRAGLDAAENESTNISQMEWVPGTHRLLYSGWTYIVQGEGESHAFPQGLFLADADAADTDGGTKSTLIPAGSSYRFSISPDGANVALTSPTGLSFLSLATGELRPDVLQYPATGVPGRILPGGAWTQASDAYLVAAPAESDLVFVSNFEVWRVPVDGSPAQALAALHDTAHDSITFSPDGRFAAYFQSDSPVEVTNSAYLVSPLVPEAGPLAVPRSAHLFWKKLGWSPDGLAYAIQDGALAWLCPDAAQDAEVCSRGPFLGERLAGITWIDGSRFTFLTYEPEELYFARLDGDRALIASGVAQSSAVSVPCQDDSALVEGQGGPMQASYAPDTLFGKTWRLRNTGSCAWDPSYRFAFQSGERLGGPHSLPLDVTVPVGGEIELSVDLVAPAEPGTYRGEWQLLDPGGAPFGVRAPVEAVVPSITVQDLPPDRVLAQVQTGPGQIALGEGALWMLSEAGVSRIDLKSNQAGAPVPAGEFPSALETGFGAVWAAAGGNVLRIDPQSGQVIATIPMTPSAGINGLAAGPDSVWASNGLEGFVYRIDPEANQVTATIPVKPNPMGIAATEDAVWVSNLGDPALVRIDPETNEVVAEIPLDCSVRVLAVDDAAVWAPCDSAPVLYRIDPQANQAVARIAIELHTSGVASGPGGAWVTSATMNTLTRIDPVTNQVTAVYRFGEGLFDLIVDGEELIVKSNGVIWRIRQ